MTLYLAAVVGLVPEEERVLFTFLFGCLGTVDGFEGVGMVACCPAGCADGEGRWREVLHLL